MASSNDILVNPQCLSPKSTDSEKFGYRDTDISNEPQHICLATHQTESLPRWPLRRSFTFVERICSFQLFKRHHLSLTWARSVRATTRTYSETKSGTGPARVAGADCGRPGVYCRAAGIDYCGDFGRADFHASRSRFITQLCRLSHDFSLVVDLARHSDPKLTSGTYDYVRLEDRQQAIARLRLPRVD